ncbi:hypothetical protein F5Y00DRAFT_273789 [Daldinia vernicosa]|uniref:uncharacterized protein n=1 Tax=Daldinia vernicosa TaxID=114800 RepID=UPI002008CE7B|nr:uncharacterized protein F5Y00DRAFT_273789 [Daldinia vernicosa]KAI0852364.1 hypothetical protein F5Y00DRAFT_273789 [Daldinia vernicosa]
MATVVTANEPLGDLEGGQAKLKSTRRVSCVRDITYKVIPCCIVSLILVSAGGVLIATLAYNKPIPQKPVIVISIMLAIFFAIFGIGGCYLYLMKHYPPLAVGPDAPDRPSVKTWRDKIKRCCELIIEKLGDDKAADETQANPPHPPPCPPPPETVNEPAELPGFNDQEPPWREGVEQPSNAQPARRQNPINRGRRSHERSTQSTNQIPRRPVPNSHYNYMQANHTTPRRSGNNPTYSPNHHADGFPMDGPSYCHGYPCTPFLRGPKPKGPRPEPQPDVPEFLWPGRAGPHVGPQIYFAYILDSINRQAFAELLPKGFVRSRLHIFEDLPIPAAYGPEEVRPKQQSRQHRKKSSEQQGDVNIPNSPITEPKDSEDMISPISTPSPSPSPKQKPSLQRPTRKDSGITAISPQDDERADEKGKTKDTGSNSPPRPPHRHRTKSEQQEAIKKGLRPGTTIDSSEEDEQEHHGPRALSDIKKDIEELSERWRQLLHEARLSGELFRGQAWRNGIWAGYSDFSDQRHSRTSTGGRSSRSGSTSPMTVSKGRTTRSRD